MNMHASTFSQNLTIVLAIVLSATAAGAQVVEDSSPGKNSVHVGVANFLITPSEIPPPIVASIAKASPGRVLEIFVTATGVFHPEARPIVAAFVNDEFPTPQSSLPLYESNCDPTVEATCTLTAMFLLDVDAAEQAFPGKFAGKPLTIAVYLADDNTETPSSAYVDAVVSARLQRK